MGTPTLKNGQIAIVTDDCAFPKNTIVVIDRFTGNGSDYYVKSADNGEDGSRATVNRSNLKLCDTFGEAFAFVVAQHEEAISILKSKAEFMAEDTEATTFDPLKWKAWVAVKANKNAALTDVQKAATMAAAIKNG